VDTASQYLLPNEHRAETEIVVVVVVVVVVVAAVVVVVAVVVALVVACVEDFNSWHGRRCDVDF
jgi:hypothetical protein